jgi:prophage maintenance system killer protein
MERDNWIQNVLNSTNGMTSVAPSDDLLSKIQQKINQQNKVSPKTVWLVAASIAVLVAINITVLKTKTKVKTESTTAYLESTINQSNQLYQ